MRRPRRSPPAAWFAAAPALLAHAAISLVVLSPRQGATVPPDSELVVVAQRTIGGVEGTNFIVQLDGHLLDPRTGRRTAGGATADIAVGERSAIPLRGLAPGLHHVEINYRPDRDEPGRATTVDFRVGTDRPGPQRLPAAVAAALALLAAVLLVRRARARARSAASPPP